MKRLFTVFTIALTSLIVSGQTMVYNRAYTAKPGDIGFNSSQYESWEYQRDFGNWNIAKLPFRFLKPKNYNPSNATLYPLIVMLHGRGEAGYQENNNNDNEMQLKWGGKQHLDAVNNGTFNGFVLFPQEPWGAWTSGNPDDTTSANQLQQPYLGMMFELVQYLTAQYKIDANRVAVHGLSSGGTGTLAAIYHRPDLFAAALPMSAAPTIGDIGSSVTQQNIQRNMGILAPVSTWWFQGDIDDNPPKAVTDVAINYWRQAGATNTNLSKYTVYANTAHMTWNKAYAEPNFFPFILAQNKKKIYVMGNNPICCGKGTDLAFSQGFYNYQWYKDGVAIAGATKHRLNNITVAGNYYVKYARRTNLAVTLTSETVTLTGGAVNASPTVNLTSPSNNSSFIAPASINLSASASDADGSVSKVDFYQGATLLFSDASAPYSYTWTGAAAGSYNLTAVATDNLGAATTSSVVNIVVASNVVPSVALTSPANNSSFIAPASINLSATASDADGSVSKVDFYQGTTLLFSDLSAPYSYSWTGVSAGSYTLTAKATDNLGASTISASVSVIVSNDTPPVVSLTSPSVGATFTAPATVNIAATATDAVGTITKVDFYQGTTLLFSDPTSPYSYSWTGVATGTYSLTAVATDNNGASTTSSPVTLTVTTNANGLTGNYYGNTAFTGSPILTRVDATVDFNWPNEPATGVPANNFGIRWTGKLKAATSETYTLYLKSDDGSRLYVNGSLLIDNWKNQAATEKSGLINLISGQQYDIILEYYDANYGAEVGLYWSTASVTKQIIPTTNLSPTIGIANYPPTVTLSSPTTTLTSPATISLSAMALDAGGTISKVDFYQGGSLLFSDATSPYSYSWTGVATGTYTITAVATDNDGTSTTSSPLIVNVTSNVNGLTGNYYGNTTFTGSPLLTRVDAIVDFVWPNSPATGVPEDNFSIRWVGKVQAATSGVYTFYLRSDDGSRLYVNGSLLVDNWGLHAAVEKSGTITLVAGQLYDIQLEYYEATGGSEARLYWSTATIAKQIVPTTSLFPSSTPSTREESYDDYVETSSFTNTTVFPQPTNGLLNVSYRASRASSVNVTMMDNLSQIKMSESYQIQKGNSILTFDVSDYTPGIYMMTIRSDEKMETVKVVIE